MLVAGATRGAGRHRRLPDRAVDSALSQAERCPAEAEVARSNRAGRIAATPDHDLGVLSASKTPCLTSAQTPSPSAVCSFPSSPPCNAAL